MDRIDTSLAILRRLNEARAIGQDQAAADLEAELELHDARHGYERARWSDARSRGQRRGRGPRRRFKEHDRVMQAGERGRNG